MEYPADVVLAALANYFWPFVRISSMMMAMTFFGARFVPSRVRLYLALAITLAAMPVLPKIQPGLEVFSLPGFMVTFQQIVIGVAMGIITQFITQTFVILGQIVGMQSSLGFASMVDPANGQNTPVLGQFYLFLALMLFLATDGHLAMIQLVVMSFKTLPVGEMFDKANFRELALWFGIMFKVALSMSLTAVIALLTVNLSFGVMTRAAPQLNIFSVGFAFALLVGLSISLFLLSGIYPHYENYWQTGLEKMCSIVRVNCSG